MIYIYAGRRTEAEAFAFRHDVPEELYSIFTCVEDVHGVRQGSGTLHVVATSDAPQADVEAVVYAAHRKGLNVDIH